MRIFFFFAFVFSLTFFFPILAGFFHVPGLGRRKIKYIRKFFALLSFAVRDDLLHHDSPIKLFNLYCLARKKVSSPKTVFAVLSEKFIKTSHSMIPRRLFRTLHLIRLHKENVSDQLILFSILARSHKSSDAD